MLLALAALALIGFAALAVLCWSAVRLVQEGRYARDPLGTAPPEAPDPSTALLKVMGPFAAVAVWAFYKGHVGWLGFIVLIALTVTVGGCVYLAAAKRRAQG